MAISRKSRLALTLEEQRKSVFNCGIQVQVYGFRQFQNLIYTVQIAIALK
jgi:hypothetical protein